MMYDAICCSGYIATFRKNQAKMEAVVSPKRHYLPARLPGVTTQRTVIYFMQSML